MKIQPPGGGKNSYTKGKSHYQKPHMFYEDLFKVNKEELYITLPLGIFQPSNIDKTVFGLRPGRRQC